MLFMCAEENHECSKPQNESLQQAVPHLAYKELKIYLALPFLFSDRQKYFLHLLPFSD